MTTQHTYRNLITGEDIVLAEWQQQLRVGDCYMIVHPMAALVTEDETRIYRSTNPGRNPPVYGQILSNEGMEEGFWWVQAYSAACPKGEMGSFHISEATRQITAGEFEAARARGWLPA